MRRLVTRKLGTCMGTMGAVLLILVAGACGILESPEGVAKEARLVVSGTSPGALELITSTKFTRTLEVDGSFSISLVVADTVFLAVPSAHDQTYPVRPDRGFLVRLTNPNDEPAVVSMQVYFDGKLRYDRQDVTLQDAALEFSYVFEN
jgi:hypothetical protein